MGWIIFIRWDWHYWTKQI